MSIGREFVLPKPIIRIGEMVDERLAKAGLTSVVPIVRPEHLAIVEELLQATAAEVAFLLGRSVSVSSGWHLAFTDLDLSYDEQDPLAVEGTVPGVFNMLYIGGFTAPGSDASRYVNCLAVGLDASICIEPGDPTDVKLLTPIRHLTGMDLVVDADSN